MFSACCCRYHAFDFAFYMCLSPPLPFAYVCFRCLDQTVVDVTSVVLPAASALSLRAFAPAHVLEPRSRYTFTVEVRLRWDRGMVTATSSASIVTAVCPAGGVVTVSPSRGIAGLTRWAKQRIFSPPAFPPPAFSIYPSCTSAVTTPFDFCMSTPSLAMPTDTFCSLNSWFWGCCKSSTPYNRGALTPFHHLCTRSLQEDCFFLCTLCLHSTVSRFNLSTAGWIDVAPGSPPPRFMFLANYHRGSPVPMNDLGPGSLLAGLLLPLSLTDANGTVEITVLAHDAGGCDTIVSPSVVVTVVPPSLANLADQYAVSDEPPGAGDGSGSASSTNLSGAILGSSCVLLCLDVTPYDFQEHGVSVVST